MTPSSSCQVLAEPAQCELSKHGGVGWGGGGGGGGVMGVSDSDNAYRACAVQGVRAQYMAADNYAGTVNHNNIK